MFSFFLSFLSYLSNQPYSDVKPNNVGLRSGGGMEGYMKPCLHLTWQSWKPLRLHYENFHRHCMCFEPFLTRGTEHDNSVSIYVDICAKYTQVCMVSGWDGGWVCSCHQHPLVLQDFMLNAQIWLLFSVHWQNVLGRVD